METTILLDHGEGGEAMTRLVRELFLRHLGEPRVLEDAAVVPGGDRIALTTDSFVVRPLFFPGGDIGRLAICGTVNDLAAMGAEPKYLSAAFIMEEGLKLAKLDRIVASMAEAAGEACVSVVTGDTKVVRRGEADGLFINTSGVGVITSESELSVAACRAGDAVLVSGPVGDHGAAVVTAREKFDIDAALVSDCRPLAGLASALLQAVPEARCMRDPTRGGLATALIDMAHASKVEIRVREERVPVRREVRAICEILGFDPLYMACEGRLLIVVPGGKAQTALDALRSHEGGREAAVIGQVRDDNPGVVLETAVGGRRPLVALRGAQLPRIC